VLDRIARALMLTEVEREHLFLLGLGRRPGIRPQPDEGVTPRLQRLLDALETGLPLQLGRGGLRARVPVRPLLPLASDPALLARHAVLAKEADDERQAMKRRMLQEGPTWGLRGSLRPSRPHRSASRSPGVRNGCSGRNSSKRDWTPFS